MKSNILKLAISVATVVAGLYVYNKYIDKKTAQ